MKLRDIAAIALLLCNSSVFADEGMWMINNLSSRTDSILQSMGLELTHEQLYSQDQPSLNDAIVMFGGFCSGVVVSPDGLVFTNHHCGFDAIHDHSTTRHDYLRDGFFAKKPKDELPNPDLYVAFHLRTIDVTDRLTAGAPEENDTKEREAYIDSVSFILCNEVSDTVRNIYGEINSYYKGQKYYLSVYQRYDDVRLVFAPPQSLGKFGGDTDNWVWPRQTCDFSVFRIYADSCNQPAPYSKGNQPYHPKKYASISLQGYQPGSYCMTLGYPGSTERYISSYGVINSMENSNAVRIQARGVILDILKEVMASSDALRIMYASKAAHSSNYWKYSIGQNKALADLHVIEEKQKLESDIQKWIDADTTAHRAYIGVLDSLKTIYAVSSETNYAMTYLEETFGGGSDILDFAIGLMFMKLTDGDNSDKALQNKIEKEYRDIDIDTDRRLFAASLSNYREHIVNPDFIPDFYAVIDTVFGGDTEKFAEDIFSKSIFAQPEKISKIKSIEEIYADPMFDIAVSIASTLMNLSRRDRSNYYEGLLERAMREMNHDREYYPDANFTLRMSYGIVNGYSPSSDITYKEYTLPASLTNKYEKEGSNPDYDLLPSVYKWLKKADFGNKYIDHSSGDLQLCFLTNNDITGGNSGSGMFDGKGRLIGLAFDGNWEAMSSDLLFNNRLQRCIGVDIRYVLSVIESYSHAHRLISELTLE